MDKCQNYIKQGYWLSIEQIDFGLKVSSFSDWTLDHEMIEGMNVCWKHIVTLSITEVNWLNGTLFYFQSRNDVVFALLDCFVCLLELGLQIASFLWCCYDCLFIRVNLIVLNQIRVSNVGISVWTQNHLQILVLLSYLVQSFFHSLNLSRINGRLWA